MSRAQRREIPPNTLRSQRLLASTLRATLKSLMKPMFHPAVPTAWLRAGMRVLTSSTLNAAGVRFQPLQLGTVRGEIAAPASPGQQAILYLHGGAYCVGSAATHRAITSHLAREASASVFAIDYRLAPEHPFPAATDDALEAYRWLLENGYAGGDIFIAGDSAGGGLTLATALQIRDLSLPAPAGLILISPWADLTHPQKSAANQPDDVMLSWTTLEHSAQSYIGDARHEPLASPLLAELHDLPATLIIAGSDEILLNDSEQLYEKLKTADNVVRLSLYQQMWHVFPAHAGLLASANQAISEMADWIAGNIKVNPAAS
ncbi:MAG: alpha/beta hydrolase [Alcanivoracaceae bacterium]|jgi:acetyl esterase/lipase|nr:alpha/beta hydrolase [Alcanivoracaceae bacterium]